MSWFLVDRTYKRLEITLGVCPKVIGNRKYIINL